MRRSWPPPPTTRWACGAAGWALPSCAVAKLASGSQLCSSCWIVPTTERRDCHCLCPATHLAASHPRPLPAGRQGVEQQRGAGGRGARPLLLPGCPPHRPRHLPGLCSLRAAAGLRQVGGDRVLVSLLRAGAAPTNRPESATLHAGPTGSPAHSRPCGLPTGGAGSADPVVAVYTLDLAPPLPASPSRPPLPTLSMPPPLRELTV